MVAVATPPVVTTTPPPDRGGGLSRGERTAIIAGIAIFVALVLRWMFHLDLPFTRGLSILWVLAVVILAVIAIARAMTTAGVAGRGLAWIALFIAILAPFNFVTDPVRGWLAKEDNNITAESCRAAGKDPRIIESGPNKGKTECVDRQPTTPTTAAPAPADEGDEWSLHNYRTDPNANQAEDHFGPGIEQCKPGSSGNDTACLNEIKRRLKKDNELMATTLVHLNLLDDFHGISREDFERKSDAEVEALRKQAADKLRDTNLRKEWYAKVEPVLNSIHKMERISYAGPHFTEGIDEHGNVYQAKKNMDPNKHYGLRAWVPGIGWVEWKADCGNQRVSKQPLPNVPVQQPPTVTTTVTTTPPGTTPPTSPPPTSPPPTSPPPTSPPPTSPPPPEEEKKPCDKQGGCGRNGRDAPPVAASLTPALQQPTPGVTPGGFEQHEQQQAAPAAQTPYVPNTAGVERPTGSTTGESDSPTGPVQGTNAGAHPGPNTSTEGSGQTSTAPVSGF
jgi:hypothetical protein